VSASAATPPVASPVPRGLPAARRGRRPGTLTVLRWELRKLRSQKRTYLGLGAAVVFPLIFVVATLARHGHPDEPPFGPYVTQTGLAAPLLMLFFGSGFLFPLIAALVSGDIVATEDHNGTLKTIFTRSVNRGQVFAGKLLAAALYTVAGLFVSMLTALIAATAAWGLHPITTFSGDIVSAGKGLKLIFAAYLVYLIPMLTVAAIALLLSAATRNSAASVVGTLVFTLLESLTTIIPGLGGLQPYILPTQFDAWHGFLRVPTDWAPIGHAAWVCALYAIPAAFVAYLIVLRRDVAGG
jgi:ABC-2 type transport system permease protein